MMTKIYEALAELEGQGRSAVLCTIVRSRGSTPRHEGSKMLVYPDGSFIGTIGGGEMEKRVIEEAKKVLSEGQPRMASYELSEPVKGDPGVCGGQVEIFLEPVTARPELIVVGGGHVGRAVAHLAQWLGFRVIVSDDRPEYATAESIPTADKYVVGPLADLADAVNITAGTSIVLCTRNVSVDVAGLPAILETPAGYIGIIGSKRRWETTRQELMEKGVAESEISRITSPMGLELNAETPEEIAVSILAEIIMLRSGGDGQPMRAKLR